MAKVKIRQYPDPRLNAKGQKVEAVDSEVRKIVKDMFETHYAAINCAALAATQLDFENPYAITVIDFSPNKDQPLCLINPEIIHHEGTQNEEGGCMSVPGGIYEKVKRAYKIRVRALDQDGKPIEFDAEGFMAKCIQHEIDHLYGKLFIDRLSRLKRNRVDKKLEKIQRWGEKD